MKIDWKKVIVSILKYACATVCGAFGAATLSGCKFALCNI